MGEHPPDVRHHRVFAFFSLHKLIASLVFVAFFSPNPAHLEPKRLPACCLGASYLVPGRSAGPPAIPSRRADPVGARGYFGHFWRAARLRQWRRPLRHGRPAPPRPALTFSLSPAGDAAALHANEAALMQMRPRPLPAPLKVPSPTGRAGIPGRAPAVRPARNLAGELRCGHAERRARRQRPRTPSAARRAPRGPIDGGRGERGGERGAAAGRRGAARAHLKP